MNNLGDRFYGYKVGDLLLVGEPCPALLKVNDRCFGWEKGDIVLHRYFRGKGIELVQDDDYLGRRKPRKFALRYELGSRQEVEFSDRWCKKAELFLFEPEMFYEGVLEFATEYFSRPQGLKV